MTDCRSLQDGTHFTTNTSTATLYKSFGDCILSKCLQSSKSSDFSKLNFFPQCYLINNVRTIPSPSNNFNRTVENSCAVLTDTLNGVLANMIKMIRRM
jgi:hypothetical protein